MKPQCWAEAVVMALKSLRLPLFFAQVLLLLHGAKQPSTQGSGHFYVTVRNTRSKTNYRGEESWRQPTFPGQRPSWRGVRASVAGTEAETMPNTDYLLRSQPPFFYSKGPRAYGSPTVGWALPHHHLPRIPLSDMAKRQSDPGNSLTEFLSCQCQVNNRK